jgi:hypothetical protein
MPSKTPKQTSTERFAEWIKNNPERRLAWQKKPEGRFNRLRKNARYQALECTLTLEEYKGLVCQPCFYCGTSLSDALGGALDRINSDIGYVQGNVRPCCKDCNFAKNAMTETEFKEWLLRIYNHWLVK